MGFKVDSSFLKFLTMGALGVRHVAAKLRAQGFEPIELERYGSSNKIWSTKVKRLRLPDLLCVRTGTRFEVRAKSELRIRMSDAPDNPDRVWDAGLRNEDIVALIACTDNGNGPVPAEKPVYFSVRDLRESVGSSRLGSPKSASEGAERDREWPATVPTPTRNRRNRHRRTHRCHDGGRRSAGAQANLLAERQAFLRRGRRFFSRRFVHPSRYAAITS